jgi:RHS repeat-associated protein
MMTALDGATRHEVYIYDANDQRIATVVSPATAPVWRYTLRDAGANVIREWTATGSGSTASWSWTKDYVHRNGALLASVADAGGAELRTHFHLDHLNTPRLLTDDEARKVSVHTYWPFGLEAEGSDRDAERMKYTGHERDFGGADGLNDLDYMHARHYSPYLGRFLSVDPVLADGHAIESPQGWNRYSYVENNPVTATDPDGRLLDTIADIGFAVYDIVDIVRTTARGEPVRAVQNIALAADLAAILIPGVTGGGAIVRASAHAGEAAHIAEGAAHTVDALRAADEGSHVVARGAQNAKVAAAARKGQEAHKAAQYGEGFEKEAHLPSGKRMDAYNAKTKQVVELKPNNPRAIKRGQKQVEQYCKECDKVYGKGHTGTVRTYEPK